MNENEVIQFFSDRMNMECIETGKEPRFVLFKSADSEKLKKIVGWATVIIKKHAYNTFDEVMIDLLDFEQGIRKANLTGIPYFIVVSYTDGIYYAEFDGKLRMYVSVKYGAIGDDPEPKTYAFIKKYDFGPVI